MKKLFLPVLLFLQVTLFPHLLYSQNLYINEVMGSNGSTISDPDSNVYSDWIEIFNAEDYAVSLYNYSVTDDISIPRKYIFTDNIVIPAKGFLLLWADDLNTGIHTNFKLSSSGETVGIYDPTGVGLDTFTFHQQYIDISEGRWPDGGGEHFRYSSPTPGTPNNSSGIYYKLRKPELSLQGGFFNSPVELTISHSEPGVSIFYTIDGTMPTINSRLYQQPIRIDTTTPIIVKAFKEGFIPSDEVVNTFLINFETELPVFSLVTDPENFFSDTAGIYITGTNGITGNCSTIPRNWNQDWERPVNLEFFEKNKELAFGVKAGVKIYGSCSRLYDVKSLAFYFRDEYGLDELNYRFFPDIPILNFNNFVLRSGGQDWYRTLIREGLVHTLVKQATDIAYQEYRPSILFINGVYWGIHNIHEKLNDNYLESHYGIDKNNIDFVEISKGIYANNGDLNAYNSMIQFLSQRNMSIQYNYDYIKSIVDINDYIDYQCTQIYAANADWPGSNMKLWRERTSDGKWRWLIYDMDFTFGGNAKGQYNFNTLATATAADGPDWPNPPWSTIMFRKLLDNQEFRNEFIQKFAVHMNTTFEPGHVKSVIDSLASAIENEIPRQKSRWAKTISISNDWYANVQLMRDFADLRQGEVRNHFNSHFNLTGSYSLIISRNNPSWGKIFTHNIEVKKNSSTNIFFDNIPLKINAFALPGYRFVKWEGADNSNSPEIIVSRSDNSYLKAVFEPIELSVVKPVINEINYVSSPSFDTEDWIEIYNPDSTETELSGWSISDNSGSKYIFPENASISANEYLVICRDTLKFRTLYPNMKIFGNLGFGLSSEGDVIKLIDSQEVLIDSVNYLNSDGWPDLTQGNGATLSLVNPQYNNDEPGNWRVSDWYGTPGRMNDTYAKSDEDFIETGFELYGNYPNPFNPVTKIKYSLPAAWKRQSAIVTLKIYDVLGRELKVIVNEEQAEGIYEVNWNAVGLTSGIYFCHLQSGKFTSTKKMILLK